METCKPVVVEIYIRNVVLVEVVTCTCILELEGAVICTCIPELEGAVICTYRPVVVETCTRKELAVVRLNSGGRQRFLMGN